MSLVQPWLGSALDILHANTLYVVAGDEKSQATARACLASLDNQNTETAFRDLAQLLISGSCASLTVVDWAQQYPVMKDVFNIHPWFYCFVETVGVGLTEKGQH